MKIRSMPRKMPRTKKLEAGHWAMIITPSSRVTRPETTTQPQGLPADFMLKARKIRSTPPATSAAPSIRVRMVAAAKGFMMAMKPAPT